MLKPQINDTIAIVQTSMNPEINNTPEVAPKKPTVSESVDNLIEKKKSERREAGIQEVQMGAESVVTEVAEVMAGVEKPKEKISEREGESGEKGDITGGGGATGEDEDMTSPVLRALSFPTEEVMVKKIRSAITTQIKIEMKRAKELQKNLTAGGAQEYNAAIARIRKLKDVLASLVSATFQYIKELYSKYFNAEGRRKPFEEID